MPSFSVLLSSFFPRAPQLLPFPPLSVPLSPRTPFLQAVGQSAGRGGASLRCVKTHRTLLPQRLSVSLSFLSFPHRWLRPPERREKKGASRVGAGAPHSFSPPSPLPPPGSPFHRSWNIITRKENITRKELGISQIRPSPSNNLLYCF